MSTETRTATHVEHVSVKISLAAIAADRWWMLVIRGIAAILFGILTLAAPRTSLLAIVYIWGAFAIIDGIAHLVNVWRYEGDGRGWRLIQGLVSIAAGVVAFAWVGLTALALLLVIAAWAIITGIAELAAAIRLRREIRGEWLLATSGVLSIVFGVLLLVFPGLGVLTLMWIIGAYAIVFGVLLIAVGARLRSWRAGAVPPPAGAVPSPT